MCSDGAPLGETDGAPVEGVVLGGPGLVVQATSALKPTASAAIRRTEFTASR